MLISIRSLSLRRLLLLDAASCAVMGAMLSLGASELAAWTRIPAGLLFRAGAALLPIAAFMALLATRSALWRGGVALIIGGNVLWMAGSLALLLGHWIAPNALGQSVIGIQAVAVALLAALEQRALCRGPAAVV